MNAVYYHFLCSLAYVAATSYASGPRPRLRFSTAAAVLISSAFRFYQLIPLRAAPDPPLTPSRWFPATAGITGSMADNVIVHGNLIEYVNTQRRLACQTENRDCIMRLGAST